MREMEGNDLGELSVMGDLVGHGKNLGFYSE